MEDCQDPTPRQLKMICLCARGLYRDEIGLQLYVSQWTVKMDLDRLRATLGARNIPHALTICIARGLLRVEGEHIIVSDDAVQPELVAA